MIAFIDPGKSSGVALYPTARPIVARFKEPTSAECLAFAQWCKANGCTKWVVENQHLPRPKIVGGKIVWRVNWPSLQGLIRIAHRWCTVGEIVGLEVEQAHPSEWQGPMFKGAPKDVDGKKLTTKQRSRYVVASTWTEVLRWDPRKGDPSTAARNPTNILPHDICDAVLMGRWWMLHKETR